MSAPPPEREATPVINWDLIGRLAAMAHPLLHIAEDLEAQIRDTPIEWTGEVFGQARTAHHLLDLAGIPQRLGGRVYASDLDARTYLAVTEITTLRERLARIQGWHARESGPAGTVGDYCTECGARWPCDTQQMAAGTYTEDQERAGGTPMSGTEQPPEGYPGGWFGASWGAPVCEAASHKPTPTGEDCLYGCGKPIAAGDQGVVLPHCDQPGRFRMAAGHLDCFLGALGLGSRATGEDG